MSRRAKTKKTKGNNKTETKKSTVKTTDKNIGDLFKELFSKEAVIWEIINRIFPYKWLRISIGIFVILIFIGWSLKDLWFKEKPPFTSTIQIVDWNGKTNNPEIYNKKGNICIDGDCNSYELTEKNEGIFKFNSKNKRKVKVSFQPQKQFNFMNLDTTIYVHKDSSTYRLKMYLEGIDGIFNCQLIDSITGKPIIDAIVEINGITDTTKANGIFTIDLPLSKQEYIQTLIVKKDGYKNYTDINFNMTTQEPQIRIPFEKK